MLRRIPPILRLGVVGVLVVAVVRTIAMIVPSVLLLGDTFGLALNALSTPVSLAICVGTFELASRLTGRGRNAAVVAGYAAAANLVIAVADAVARTMLYSSTSSAELGFEVIGVISMAVFAVGTIAYGVAAWSGGGERRHHIAAVGWCTLAVLAFSASWFVPVLFPPSDNALRYAHVLGVVHGALSVVHAIALIALITLARPSTETIPSIPLAARGFRLMAGSLWWRLVATVVGAYGMARLVIAFSDPGSSFQIAFIAQAGFEMLVFAAFALGAFVVARAGVDGTPRRTFMLAGTAAGWCAGVMLAKIPYLYIFTTATVGDLDLQMLDSLSIGEPLVAVAAVAIAVFALRSIGALASVADIASSRGLAFVVAMLISVALANVGTGSSESMLLLGFGGVFALVSLGLVATVMSRAARALEAGEPALPTATAINAPEA